MQANIFLRWDGILEIYNRAGNKSNDEEEILRSWPSQV
jgi:hypothetical protein